MTAIVEVVPFAVFNARAPIVVAVRVLKGPLVRSMEVREQATQVALGTITHIEKDSVEALEGVAGDVYAIKIEATAPSQQPTLRKEKLLLECTL